MSEVTFQQALPDLAAKIKEAAKLREESWIHDPKTIAGLGISPGRYGLSLTEDVLDWAEGILCVVTETNDV
jgi:hypothetical protein